MNIKKLSCGLVAVFVGFSATALQAQNESQPMESEVFEDALHFYQWVTPEYPPMPDIEVNGEWLPWEDVYGPCPAHKFISLSRPDRSSIKQEKSFNSNDPFSVKRLVNDSLAVKKVQKIFSSESDKDSKKLFSIGYFPANRVDSVKLSKITELNNEKTRDGNPSTNTYGLSASTNLVFHYFGKIEYTIANTNMIFTDYLIGIENIPGDGVPEVFFTDDLSSENWCLAPLTGAYQIPTEDSGIQLTIPALTVEGRHGKGFFCASLMNDLDGDGISDVAEVLVFKSDPSDPDSAFLRDENRNGIPDFSGKEGNWISDGDEDLDGDGWSNSEELLMGTNPFVAQNNDLDTDDDGLPDWAESRIYWFWGIYNPSPYGDADGDGVDNYTELALRTDPTYPNFIYNKLDSDESFALCPGRTFTLDPIFVQRGSTNSYSTNGMIFDSVGMLGTYLHAEVIRNYGGTNGYDAILLAGAYLTPTSTNWMSIASLGTGNETPDVIRSSLVSPGTLAGSGIRVLDDIWYESDVTGILNQLNAQQVDMVVKRSFARVAIITKQMQQDLDFTNLSLQSPAVRIKINNFISELFTEIRIQEQALARRSSLVGPFSGTLIGTTLNLGSFFCSIVNTVNIPSTLMVSVRDYVNAVNAHSDPGGFDTLDLAYGIQNYVMNITGANLLVPLNYYLYLVDVLKDFDGYYSN